jgi:DNA repair exonuclease SbcCD ATPase subunit
MRITKIELGDWMPFRGVHKLDVPSGPISVVAKYTEDPERSNWGGKTAFEEGIEWCIYGIHRKTYEDRLIHNGQESTFVRLTFSGGDVVERSRVRGKTTKIRFKTSDGIEYRQKDASEAIEKFIGLDNQDFRATLCFAQGDTEAIVSKKSGERRKLIGQWLEFDAWFRVASRARVALRASLSKVQSVTRRLAEIETFFAEHNREELAIELSKTIEESNKFSLLVDGCQKRIDKANRAASAKTAVAQLEELKIERASLIEELRGAKVEGLEQAKIVFEEAKSSEDQASKELRSAKSLLGGSFDGKCPVVCIECPIAETISADKKSAAEKVSNVEKVLGECSHRTHSARLVLGELTAKERELQRKRERFNQLTATGKRLASIANESDGLLSDEDFSKLTEERDRYQTDLKNSYATKRIIEKLLEDISIALTEQQELLSDLEEARRDAQIKALALKCVGPTGIPQQIMFDSLGRLEERSNGLLDGTGLSISFDTEREMKDLEPICSDCGYTYRGQKDKSCPACETERQKKMSDDLEIPVDDGSGEIEDAKAKSGGAKALIASAIRMSASLMLRELRGSACSFALVDEPFGSLDLRNRRILAQVFTGFLGSVGLEQAFVISHDAALLDSLPGRIEITRNGDASTIKVV